MVYRSYHDCGIDCKRLASYVRIDGNWTRIGHYCSGCKQFELLDLQQEEKERLAKEGLEQFRADLRQIKQENRARLKIIDSELNVNNSFFK